MKQKGLPGTQPEPMSGRCLVSPGMVLVCKWQILQHGEHLPSRVPFGTSFIFNVLFNIISPSPHGEFCPSESQRQTQACSTYTIKGSCFLATGALGGQEPPSLAGTGVQPMGLEAGTEARPMQPERRTGGLHLPMLVAQLLDIFDACVQLHVYAQNTCTRTTSTQGPLCLHKLIKAKPSIHMYSVGLEWDSLGLALPYCSSDCQGQQGGIVQLPQASEEFLYH